MKRDFRHIIWFWVLPLLLLSCTQPEADIPTPELTFADKIDASFESIALSCIVSGNVTAEKLIIEYAKDKDLIGAMTQSFEKKGDSFNITISGLEIQTTYYYRYTVENKASSYTDEKIRQFKTLDYVVPVVTTGVVKDVSGTKATLEGNVDFTCGKTITAQGFKFGKDQNKLEDQPAELTSLSLKVEGLDFETTYYYQAYATTEIGTGYGEIKEFKTSNAVSFKAIETKEITASSAVIFGGVLDNGGIEVDQQGFRYGEDGSEDFTFVASTGESKLENLKAATTYKVWYYAKTFEGEFESDKIVFSTSTGLVDLEAATVTNVLAQSATFESGILSSNGADIIESGFCYSTTERPDLEDSKVKTSSSGEMSVTVTSLTVSTKYYVRAYATTNIGTTYSVETSFTTKSGVIELDNLSVSDVLPESVCITVNLLDDGGTSVEERGFCYSTTDSPTILNNKLTINTQAYTFNGVITSLIRSTKYYVRAYAKNELGVFYSGQISFSTPSGLASLGTLVSSSVESTSAEFSCEITSDGGASIAKRGFCYSTGAQPTVYSSVVSVNGDVGSMQSKIDNLEPGTTYYVRAFATTDYGTVYSNEVSVKTKLGLPTMSPVSITDIQPTSACFSSGIAKEGDGYVLEKGYCYSQSPSPDKGDTIIYANSSWVINVTGLEQNTTYYVKSFATTQYGTSYSEEVSFTTTYNPVEFGSISASFIDVSRATIQCEVVSYGGNSVIEEGFCISTSPGASTTDNKYQSNGEAFQTITSLTKGVTYYVKRYVINQIATFYSDETSFTTFTSPDNTINGLYSVSDSKKVVFSPANLWYERETMNSFFAPKQYSITGVVINELTGGGGAFNTYDVLDIWQASKGLKSKYTVEDYSRWRILSKEEWYYLINERQNATALIRYDVVVDGIKGVLLLPDTWPGGYSIQDGNLVSKEEFSIYDSLGCVFLPYAGSIGDYTSYGYIGQIANLWTSTQGYEGQYYHYYIAQFRDENRASLYGEAFTIFYVDVSSARACIRLVADVD